MFNKFIPIIIAAASFIIWEAVIADPKNFWYSLAVFLVVFVSGFLKLHGFKTAHKKEAWLLAAPPFFLAAFAGVMLLFLNVPWVAHALTFAVAAAVYIYLARIYTFLFAITRYQPLALERLSSFMAVASFTFAGIAAYGCMNFLNASVWQTALAVAAVSFILTYQFFWVNKIDEQQNVFASLLVTILLVEFFWAISFFPVTHFISGLALAILYYVVVNLTLLHFLDKLEKKLAGTYLVVGGVCILMALLSAKWL